MSVPLARIVVRDAALHVVGEGSGVVSVDVAPGVYAATVTDGRSRVEQLIKVGVEPTPPVDVAPVRRTGADLGCRHEGPDRGRRPGDPRARGRACDHVRSGRPRPSFRQRRVRSRRSGAGSESAVCRRSPPVPRRASGSSRMASRVTSSIAGRARRRPGSTSSARTARSRPPWRSRSGPGGRPSCSCHALPRVRSRRWRRCTACHSTPAGTAPTG